MNIGLVPFARLALKHTKVGYMLGKGDESEEMTMKIQK